MKNTRKRKPFFPLLIKLVMITQIIVFFTGIFTCMPLQAKPHSMRNNIDLNLTNVPLSEVMGAIEKSTGYKFVYSNIEVDVTRKVSIRVKNEEIHKIVLKLFPHNDIIFRGKNIVLTLKEKPTPPLQEDQSQKRRITGKIIDENGEPVIGANVLEAGTPTNGTVTDESGSFVLNVDEKATLYITYIGYISQEIKVTTDSDLSIVLREDSKMLHEVVVTALGIEKDKKTLTYSTQQLSMKDLTTIKDVSLGNTLAGKIAGVNITSSTGSFGVGGDPRIVIRGNRSIFGNNQPLIVVDGNPYASSGGGLSSINPDDVVSMNILKGPTAAALYGSSAQNGAIIITSKKGKAGDPKIEFNSSTIFDIPYLYPEFQDTYGQGNNGAFSSASEVDSWGPKMKGQQINNWNKESIQLLPQKNNIKDFFETGYTLTNSISYNSGNEKSSSYFSYANTTAKGVLWDNKMQRHNFNLRLTSELLKNLTFDYKITWFYQNIKDQPTVGDDLFSPMMQLILMPRSIRTQDIEKAYYINDAGAMKQLTWAPGSTMIINPYWSLKGKENPTRSNTINSLAVLKYRFTDWLYLQLRAGILRNNTDSENKLYWDTQYVNTGKGFYSKNFAHNQVLNSDFLFSFNKNINKDLFISANVGGEIRDTQSSSLNSWTSGGLTEENKFGLAYGVGKNSSETESHIQKQSLYGMLQLAFKQYLYLDATYRTDWSSTLPSPHRYSYPSIGMTGIVSEMIKLPEFISFAKIRGTYAEVGNDAPRSMIYQTYDTNWLGFVYPKNVKMPVNLIPEKTKSWEVGTELKFFKNRLGIDLTYYKSNTYNQLMSVTTPLTSGYERGWINAGNIQNEGVEVMLSATPLLTKDYNWSVNLNFAKNKNKVIELTKTIDKYAIYGPIMAMGQTWVYTGRPYGEIYTRGFERNDEGEILVDDNGRPYVQADYNTYLGNFNYDWTGSFSNNFEYKKWSLYFLIDLNYGGIRTSATESWMMFAGSSKETLKGRDGFVFEGVKKSNGQKNDIYITAEQYGKIMGGRPYQGCGELFSHSATNSRLRELSLGYTIPLHNTMVRSLQVSAVGRNLFYLYNGCKWFDPDGTYDSGANGQGAESAFLPGTRSLGINIKVNF